MSDQLNTGLLPIGAVKIPAVAPVKPVAEKPKLRGLTATHVIVDEVEILTLAQVEQAQIEKVLAILGNNKAKAANALGITVKTLYNKLHDYGLFEKYKA